MNSYPETAMTVCKSKLQWGWGTHVSADHPRTPYILRHSFRHDWEVEWENPSSIWSSRLLILLGVTWQEAVILNDVVESRIVLLTALETPDQPAMQSIYQAMRWLFWGSAIHFMANLGVAGVTNFSSKNSFRSRDRDLGSSLSIAGAKSGDDQSKRMQWWCWWSWCT